MLFDRIDHIIIPIENLDAALEPFKRLGLALSPPGAQIGRGTRSALFAAGGEDSWFGVEFLLISDREEALHARGSAFVEAAEQRRGALALMLGTEDLSEAVATLRERGLDPSVAEIRIRPGDQPASGMQADQGTKMADVAELHAPPEAAMDVRLVQFSTPRSERFARWTQRLSDPSSFPLKRLDHLAAFTRDLDASTRFWSDILGVPLHGEVRTPAMIIRQLKIGDAILELLGAASPDSPAAQRPSGLASMAAFEVTDMAAAVARARAAGFTLPDPGPGPLPGTRVTTIPGDQLSGFSLQLLEYM